jgi:hypothetical protein
MYLDCDTTPPLASTGVRAKTVKSATKRALAMIEAVSEGQIGIYTAYGHGEFIGFVIKNSGETPYFEPAGA